MHTCNPFLLVILIGISLWAVGAEEAWTEADTRNLVESVRHPPIAECWAVMKGVVNHKADGKSTVKLPIQMRARFSPDRSLAQLIFNRDEYYLIGQNFEEGAEGTSVIAQQEAVEGATALRDVGIRPSDITLSFLYWDFVAERGAERFKGQNCRILEFVHPDAAESVHVWVSIKQGFPLMVKWFRNNEQEPYRQLQITGLKKVHDIWVVSEARVSNPGWRTQIDFKEIELEQVSAEAPMPDTLFLQPPDPAE